MTLADSLRGVRDRLIRAQNRGAGAVSVEDAFNSAVADAGEAELMLETIVQEVEVSERWQPIETAPKGYDGTKFNYVLFRGVSRGRPFDHPVAVTGYLDHDGRPVHFYNYALRITHWMRHPDEPRGGR